MGHATSVEVVRLQLQGDLDLTVAPGETLAIVGASGAMSPTGTWADEPRWLRLSRSLTPLGAFVLVVAAGLAGYVFTLLGEPEHRPQVLSPYYI